MVPNPSASQREWVAVACAPFPRSCAPRHREAPATGVKRGPRVVRGAMQNRSLWPHKQPFWGPGPHLTPFGGGAWVVQDSRGVWMYSPLSPDDD